METRYIVTYEIVDVDTGKVTGSGDYYSELLDKRTAIRAISRLNADAANGLHPKLEDNECILFDFRGVALSPEQQRKILGAATNAKPGHSSQASGGVPSVDTI